MESMFEGTGLTELDIYQDPKAALRNQMGTFDEADVHKYYDHAHGKYDETVTIASISHHIGRKMHALENTAPPPDINISPANNT